MKIITTNLLNRFWKNGIKPIKEELANKLSASKVVESPNITEEGFVMGGRTASEQLAELNGKSYADGYVFVEFGAVPNKDVKEVVANGVPSDAKHVWIDAAWAKKTTTGMVIPLPYVDVSNVSNGIRTAMISGKVQISTNADWNNYNAWFIIAYKL